MAKYINVPQAMYPSSTATNAAVADSGTTSAATAGKLTEAGQNFLTTVNVGDYAVITTAVGTYTVRTYAIVTAVDSDTVLSVKGSALPATGTGGLSASGTAYSIIAAANAFKCDLSAAGFGANVTIGNTVCNTTTNLNYTITKVVSNTELLIDHPAGIIVGDDFFILSDNSEHGQYQVCLDKVTEIRGNDADGEVTIHYKRGATSQKLAIAMGDAVTDDAYFTKFSEVALSAWRSRWSDVSVQMPVNPSSGTQGVQWGGTFTWS
tara:strand:- start:1557 stop:2348 length:792 start_codon:yes stop_codon:yes gene_type:complete